MIEGISHKIKYSSAKRNHFIIFLTIDSNKIIYSHATNTTKTIHCFYRSLMACAFNRNHNLCNWDLECKYALKRKRILFYDSNVWVILSRVFTKNCPRLKTSTDHRGKEPKLDLKINIDYPLIHSMLTKYRDTPKNYVDAGLILIGEKLKITEILTIDSDFSVYKFKNGNQFKNLLQEVLRKKDFLLIKQT